MNEKTNECLYFKQDNPFCKLQNPIPSNADFALFELNNLVLTGIYF